MSEENNVEVEVIPPVLSPEAQAIAEQVVTEGAAPEGTVVEFKDGQPVAVDVPPTDPAPVQEGV